MVKVPLRAEGVKVPGLSRVVSSLRVTKHRLMVVQVKRLMQVRIAEAVKLN
jgi:hypothetical protein